MTLAVVGTHRGWIAATALLVSASMVPAQSSDEAARKAKPSGDVARREHELRQAGYLDDESPAPLTRDWRHMNEPQRDALVKFMEDHFPEVGKEVADLRKGDGRPYETRMERLAAELMPILEEQARNPGRAEILIREKQLEFRIQAQVAEYWLARDEQRRDKSRKKLRELVAKLFDTVQERQKLDIQRLEERISFLKKRLDDKAGKREQVIDQWLDNRLNPGGESTTGKSEEKDKDKGGKPAPVDAARGEAASAGP